VRITVLKKNQHSWLIIIFVVGWLPAAIFAAPGADASSIRSYDSFLIELERRNTAYITGIFQLGLGRDDSSNLITAYLLQFDAAKEKVMKAKKVLDQNPLNPARTEMIAETARTRSTVPSWIIASLELQHQAASDAFLQKQYDNACASAEITMQALSSDLKARLKVKKEHDRLVKQVALLKNFLALALGVATIAVFYAVAYFEVRKQFREAGKFERFTHRKVYARIKKSLTRRGWRTLKAAKTWLVAGSAGSVLGYKMFTNSFID
jgi:hypothetical protein